MGWFDGSSEVGSSSHRKSSSKHGGHSHSRQQSSPRASSVFGLGAPEKEHHRSHSRSHSTHDKPRGSTASLFGLGESNKSQSHDKPRGNSIFGSGDGRHNSSRSSFFGFGSGHSSSYYKRSPRQGFLKRMYTKLRRLLRDLMYYMKKNPMKVFMLVIMPLITGGALTTLLAKFGLRLPHGLARIFGGASGGGKGVSSVEWEHSKVSGPLGRLGTMASTMGGMGGIGGAMSLAKMFM